MKIIAIKINQPLANIYITKIKAKDLLEISFSEQLEYIDDSGRLKGSQRQVDKTRLKEIGRYIDSVEMSFPNTIILAANYNENGEVVDDLNIRWALKDLGNDIFEINIPTNKRLAAIVDGQHRLFAFNYISRYERDSVELPCSIFFDLPNSYQAFLFATINGNQKKVDKSLALEQFGFNVEDEPRKSWTPEKLAVFITRKLNFSKELNSPLLNRIKVAPIYEEPNSRNNEEHGWVVSTATVVSGILSLISNNPKRDRVEMGQKHIFKGRERSQLKGIKDASPLRQLFFEVRDDEIINIVNKYFEQVANLLWTSADSNSYIFKTVGIQALFDLLKKVLSYSKFYDNINYEKWIQPVIAVDFGENYFQASGVGRSRIKKVLFAANDFDTNLNDEDIKSLKRLIGYEKPK